ncbi:Mu transposase C-terminal domain-containing protein [Amycolatopsis rubida]|uniref:Mu transposase, C-terminal n=1 Tax=Amycolatopsis rubida TaxID=112413 RepID=A0A1I5X5Y8_9PSEU|nr:Mu transposase C-terminal domain-containing protein [Amycolatopsis rubida]SFQ27236.1 Mu transposase, C-terminal [Amycolatopsis rubida]
MTGNVVRVGDEVFAFGETHLVGEIDGVAIRLESVLGGTRVVTLPTLLAAEDFTLVGTDAAVPSLPPLGMLDALPPAAVEAARRWEQHVVEVVTGRAPQAPESAPPRPGFDPETTTLAEREQRKADELSAAGQPVSTRTLRRMRTRYRAQGLWGLLDQRLLRTRTPYGRADERLVAAIAAAIAAETETSTGTRDRLRKRVRDALDAEHGPGAMVLPSKATFNRLVAAMTTGKHTFGQATTRRSLANRPERPFTPITALRPGDLVQIDTTPLDVMTVLDDGTSVRPELTYALDVATRSICAIALRPAGTKAVDAALLLARMLVPEQLRPNWPTVLGMRASVLPHEQLAEVDPRLAGAAGRPVIVPETIVCDHGTVFISATFIAACDKLGISFQPTHKGSPWQKGNVETGFGSINTLFSQYAAGYTGPNTTRRGRAVDGAWLLPDLADLVEQWIVAGWQNRPHEGLRHPRLPGRAASPNEMYAALVASAGYLPLPLTGTDYLELLPATWRAINDYGIRINHRTYDADALNPHRRQHSGITSKRGLWEVHHDPYDCNQVWVRNHHDDGRWITAHWTHRDLVTAPFAEFTWQAARAELARRGGNATEQAAIALVLDELLTRVGAGPAPAERKADRISASTRRAVARGMASPPDPRPPLTVVPPLGEPEPEIDDNLAAEDDELGEVIPFGIFDAHAEAERMW